MDDILVSIYVQSNPSQIHYEVCILHIIRFHHGNEIKHEKNAQRLSQCDDAYSMRLHGS